MSRIVSSVALRILASLLLLLAALSHSAKASLGWAECSHHFLMVPYEPSVTQRLCREGIVAISYDVPMINPAFSMYYVTPEQAKNLIPGRTNFYQDPDLKALGIAQATVTSKAFSNDWNRGHLAPSHLLSFSDAAKKAVYTMANIAPQGYYFNQHPWETVESKVASWIAANKALYLITGVAYKNRSTPTRTADSIAIPDYYWKVMCEPTTGNSAGFWGINSPDTKATTDFVTVQEIEKMYGGPLLPADTCKTAVVDKSFWW